MSTSCATSSSESRPRGSLGRLDIVSGTVVCVPDVYGASPIDVLLVLVWGVWVVGCGVLLFILVLTLVAHLYLWILPPHPVYSVSVGCWSLVLGAMRYFICTSGETWSCDQIGPSLRVVDAVAFFVQIVLVWLAYWLVRSQAAMPSLECLRQYRRCRFRLG